MKDFGEFLELLIESHDDIMESVRRRTLNHVSQNPGQSRSEEFLDTHFETLEILERYHKWLYEADQ